MKLEKIGMRDILPMEPFDFNATFHKPDHFTSRDNSWEPGIRWQTWNWQGKQLGLKFVRHGAALEPSIFVELYYQHALDDAFINGLMGEVRYRYNLDCDLSAFYAAFADDPVLGPITRRWRGMRPGHPSSLYEYLVIGIVLQNATVRRSMQMFQALLEQYGKRLEFDGNSCGVFGSLVGCSAPLTCRAVCTEKSQSARHLGLAPMW